MWKESFLPAHGFLSVKVNYNTLILVNVVHTESHYDLIIHPVHIQMLRDGITYAIFRFKDYQAANIPVLPVVKGISVAKNHITLYIIAFAVATLMLSLGGYAGYKYLVVAAAVSVWWLGMALRGYKVADDRIWARKLFGFSIIAITALSVMMSVDFMVPDSHTLLAAVW